MSDSKDSTVTYTQISSPFADSSDIGSPGVDGPPILPDDPYAYVVAAFHAPPSPDYVPGPEEPQEPLPLDFVPEPVYPEFIPPDDEVLPAEEQPLPYLLTSHQVISRREEPSGDDANDEDEDEDEGEEEEEEEHPAPVDSVPPIPSPPLPASPPASPIRSLGYRAAMIRLRAEAASTSHLLPLPSPIILSHTRPVAPLLGTPPLHLLSTDRKEDRPETGESSAAAAARPIGGSRADYEFVGAACADFDIDAVTTGTCDHFTGIGDNTARIAGTL
ncbi:hypothetical protein Tco_1201137 [Tanacetum coccineum]